LAYGNTYKPKSWTGFISHCIGHRQNEDLLSKGNSTNYREKSARGPVSTMAIREEAIPGMLYISTRTDGH